MRYRVRLRKEPAQIAQPGFWHLTLCTLLSSQGSGAPEYPPCGFVFRATALTYHQDAAVATRATTFTGWIWSLLRPESSAAFPHLWGDK